MKWSQAEISDILEGIEFARQRRMSGTLAKLAKAFFKAQFKPHTKDWKLLKKVESEIEAKKKRK